MFSALKKTRYLLAMMIVLGAAIPLRASTTTGNLLTDPGWNTPLTNPLANYTTVVGSPFNQNVWGEENSSVVASGSGIVPFEGNGMLQMNDDGLTVTQIWQRVDVSFCGFEIDNGWASADLSALFNVPAGLTGAASRVIIGFYDASNVSTGSISVVTEGSIGGLDADPNTWQQISNLGASVPFGTRILEAQFSYVNASMAGQPGFVDAADLRLIVVPEPASAVLLGCGSFLALMRRRTPSIHSALHLQL